MKVTVLQQNERGQRKLHQFFRIMRFTMLLLLVGSMHVYADGFSQSKISLRLQQADLKKALSLIEKQTNVRFLYNQNVVKNVGKVSVDANNEALVQVLDDILKGTGVTYKLLEDDLVVLNFDDEFYAPADVKVSGTVTDSLGNPIPGASVTVKGTKNGTSTDGSGKYSISVTDNATLVFSAIGFATFEEKVNGRTSISPALMVSEKKLDEVVVIGYGTASKRDLTGSIVKVAGKEVADKPNPNPVASLQSKVTGLYVVNSGTPGQQPDIRIRGTVSIGQVHPLYVVDGILQDNIDYLNPNDIESIEVLKDPSSLAIFGVRGATGAIAISTKRAKAGQTLINFNTTYGFKTLVDKIQMADAKLFDELFAEENANNGVATPDYSALKGNTNWIDQVTRTGHYSATNLSIAQSTDKNKFNMGIGYISDEGIILHEKLERMILSFADEYKVNKFFKLGINMNVSRQHNPFDATSVLDNARKTMPQIEPGTKKFTVQDPYSAAMIDQNIYSDVDRALQNSGVINPLLEVENTWNKTLSYTNRMVGSVFAEFNFLKDFTFRPTWYADMSNVDYRSYNPLYYAYNPVTGDPYLYNTKTTVNQSKTDYKKFQQDYILNWKKKLGDHSLAATGGFTTYYFGTFGMSGTSTQGTGPSDLPIPNTERLWYLNNGFGYVNQGGATSNQSEYTTVSWLGRVLYNYKNKYYVNASFRDDASSRIPEKNRHQQFWSVGGAYEISKEDFMQNQHIFDFLKIKGSVGLLGNQSTYGPVGDYPAYPGLKPGVVVPFGSNLVTGALPAYKVNPDLKWETVNAWEIGVEGAAFNNRLHFEYNHYNKVTKNMMTYVSLGSLGLDDELTNGGEIKNWGDEISATWNQSINKDWSLTIGGNITFMKNKVISVAEDLPGGVIINGFMNNGSAEARTMPGYPIGSFYGYVVDGLYQSKLDILQSPLASSLGSYAPGDFKFRDVNHDGVIDANDRTVIGNPSPNFMYGGTIGANYKRFNLNIDFGGVYGNEIFRTWGSLESPFQRVNYPAFKAERWHGAGTSNWEPIISQAHRFNYNGSTYNMEDGSYFRIRNLQIGYDFNPAGLAKAKIKGLRVFANVQNLKTWKHNKGYTTEYGGSATAFGFDNAGGAIPRVTTFGLNVTF